MNANLLFTWRRQLGLESIETNDLTRILLKFAEIRPYAATKAAALKLLEIANAVEAVQDRRIHIEKINEPFLYEAGGTPAEYKAGLNLALERGWLFLHESGTYVKFTQAGAPVRVTAGYVRNRADNMPSKI